MICMTHDVPIVSPFPPTARVRVWVCFFIMSPRLHAGRCPSQESAAAAPPRLPLLAAAAAAVAALLAAGRPAVC